MEEASPMEEAIRTYLELAMGLTETSRKRVRKVVKDVVKEAVGRSGATAEQVKALSGDLIAANAANREALAKLVRFEVDRALGMVGLATAEEVGELTQQVRDLKEQLREAQAGVSPNATKPTSAKSNARTTRAKAAPAKATAKAIAAKEAPASRTPSKRTAAAKKATATATTRTTAAQGRSAPKKAAPKKTVAKKNVAKKAVARKAASA
jgi:polyhydroxyalkanoate synthesis regulator phasin